MVQPFDACQTMIMDHSITDWCLTTNQSVHQDTVMSSCVQVTFTVDSEEVALLLARSIVEVRLAACAQVAGPIRSVFRWQNVIQQKCEWHCYLKTTERCVRELEVYIEKHYPADTPEIIAIPIVDGSAAYISWIQKQVSKI